MASRDTDDLETAFIGFIADAEAARQKQAGIEPPRPKEGGRQRSRGRDGGPDRLRRGGPAHDHDDGPA